MALAPDEQVELRQKIVAATDAEAIKLVKEFHDRSPHGCGCGQEHEWIELVRAARSHDAAQSGR